VQDTYSRFSEFGTMLLSPECEYRVAYILSRDFVTTDGVYWTLTECNYKQLWQSHWVTHSKNHSNYSTHEVFSIFTSRCLVAAFQQRTFLLIWVPELSQAAVTNFSRLTTVTLNRLNNWTTSPRYIAPTRTAQKTSLPLLHVLSFPAKETSSQSSSLATAVDLPPVYTAVTWQWIYMSQYQGVCRTVQVQDYPA
jgi:hypothetical protein